MSAPGAVTPQEVARALEAWPAFADARVTRIAQGLIHHSFTVQGGDGEYVLQRVNPIFSPRIHDNIRAVTEHLHRKGLTTLRLVPTKTGGAYADLGEAGIWRLATRVPGASLEVCPSAAHARAAAGLAARFHAALADLRHEFRPPGIPLHQTAHHLAELEATLVTHRTHRLYDRVAPLAAGILGAAERLAPLDDLPSRPVHGDLKFNNVLFAPDGPGAAPEAIALIDLDTLSRQPLCVELGDAWRSWCNRSGEDSPEAALDLGLLRAAVEGYLHALPLELAPVERASLAEGLERISLELAARFAADALRESYFGWDPARFASRGEHNLIRALGQWSLHEQARAARAEILGLLG